MCAKDARLLQWRMENGDGDALQKREQTYMRAEAVRRRACMATLGLNGGGEGVELVGLYS